MTPGPVVQEDSRTCVRLPGAVLVGVLVLAGVVSAQQQFQIFIAAADSAGRPVTDLQPRDVLMAERSGMGRILRLEPHPWPVQLTVLVDNGIAAQNALVHYRTGLRRLVDALPRDVTVSLIATAPNPRWLVRPTSDITQIRRGIDLLTIDDALGRSNDAFVEFAERLDAEFKGLSDTSQTPYRPVLVSIATTGRDGSTVMRDPLLKMLASLVRYRTMVSIAMLSVGGGRSADEGTHLLVAKAAQDVTGGRYEAIADSNRLTTLLPEFGREIAQTHGRQMTQYRATIERAEGASGPVDDFRLSIARDGVSYVVSADGAHGR